MRVPELVRRLLFGFGLIRCDLHRWRPAMTSKGPARYCDDCEKTEQLTMEEFYAQFGTVPYVQY